MLGLMLAVGAGIAIVGVVNDFFGTFVAAAWSS